MMEMNKYARAKSSFLMMAFGGLFALVQSFLTDGSPLSGILSLASAVLTFVAVWKLRAVEDGYRNAFMVGIIALIFSMAGVGLASWAAFSGQTAMATLVVILVALVPVALGAVVQYFFCTATGRVMQELNAEQEALWSGWMWKLYGATAIFSILCSILAMTGRLPQVLTTVLQWVTLAVGVLQLAYYFLCYRAFPTE